MTNRFLRTAAILSLLTTPALAAPSVAVSVRGADAASCGALASPCRTLQYAINLTDAGGKVDIIDSGEFGPADIRKPLTVSYDGKGVALVQPSAAGRNAILIYSGATGAVRLRGLTIDGGGIGAHGVYFLGGARLELADCVVRNFTGNGAIVNSPGSSFSIVKSVFSDNGAFGLRVNPISGVVRGVIDGSRLISNGSGGVSAENGGGGSDVTMLNSLSMGPLGASPSAGVQASGANARISVRSSTLTDNSSGAKASAGGIVRLSDSIVLGNSSPASPTTGGTVESTVDNIVHLRPLGGLTPVPRQ